VHDDAEDGLEHDRNDTEQGGVPEGGPESVQNLSPEPVKMSAKFFIPTNGSVSLTNPVSGSSPGWP